MITEVDLSGTPCFETGTTLKDLKKVNFIFGPNGSGKTTLSNIFQNPSDVRLHWENNTIGTTYIFNRNFTANALASSTKLKGVFFIGRGATNTQQVINKLDTQLKLETIALNDAQKDYATITLREIEEQESFERIAWKIKKTLEKHPLYNCLKGAIKSRSLFAETILSTKSNNEHEITLEALKSRAEQLYANELDLITEPPLEWTPKTNPHTLARLLATAITPSSKSKLLPLIQEHELIDFVTTGYNICKTKDITEVCPYCQQELSETIRNELDKLFDQTFTQARSTLLETFTSSTAEYNSIKSITQKIMEDCETVITLKGPAQQLKTILTTLKQINSTILYKVEHPSQELQLPSPLEELHEHIRSTLHQCKEAYEQHNKVVQNLTSERLALRDDLWNWLTTDSLAPIIQQHRARMTELQKQRADIETKLTNAEKQVATTKKRLEEQITQLQNSKEAMDRINTILNDLGFNSFKLDYDTPSKGYRIIRPNSRNSICNVETLSEGEKTILTFLYFIQKVDGSSTWLPGQEPTVIIDDPIASTDAQSFFLVTQFIRRMTVYLKNPAKSSQQFKVSQLIVCTHNTRFLSEASYDCKSGNKAKDPYAHFFRLQKHSTGTTISEGTHENHIDSEYNLLWREIKACTEEYNAHLSGGPAPDYPLLGNTMRRIIESYSKMLGSGGVTKLSQHPSIAVSTLVAFCNSTSHSAIDTDLHSIYSLSTSQLLQAFRQFFETEFEDGAHFPHYCSMMELSLKDQGWRYPKITTP